MRSLKKTYRKHTLPLLPLRGLTVFPYMIIPFDVGRVASIKAIEECMIKNQKIFLVTQKDPADNRPKIEDIYDVGTISKIKQLIKLPGDTIRVLVEGESRAKVDKIIQEEPFFLVESKEIIYKIPASYNAELEALRRRILDAFENYLRLGNKVSPENIIPLISNEDFNKLSDIIISNMILKTEIKQEILSEFNPIDRLTKLYEVLLSEIEVLEIENRINTKVRKQIDKMQKEYYLREQLKVIKSELGDKDGTTGEIEEYKKKMKDMDFPKEVVKKAEKELSRLLKMPPGSAESSVIRTYVDWLIELPWCKKTKEVIDLEKGWSILEEDHYGLTKVKERIIEYLAIRKFKNTLKGPIICFVGPPGVGKTSVAKSIARVLNRNYVRMSLGGIKDESEIRGHRRTYVGAMPGRIISAIKQSGSKNPLILLDEIDKLNSDFRGDPASALLEVLDSEQNHSFRDHYLEIPFDLSDVMFITTANNIDTIPKPLLDRMEVITLSSYTEEEKVAIAQTYLVPKQRKAHGLRKREMKINEKAIRELINYYTRESGVRELERQIAAVCRKVVKHLVSDGKKSMTINSEKILQMLGKKKYRHDIVADKNEIGIARGLAWTPVGGETLIIEVSLMKGTGKVELTGHLGQIMKESASAAMSYIRSRADSFYIPEDFHSKYDVHIHVPEGAIHKDGPSAGITLATAMVSAFTGIPVIGSIAMTGEITLRGRVLPIGGLKEKVLAAHRAGIKTVILPEENNKDIEEIPDNIKNKIKFILVKTIDEVLCTALERTNFDCNITKEPLIIQNDSAIEDNFKQNSTIIKQ